jgi:hypothetical protein
MIYGEIRHKNAYPVTTITWSGHMVRGFARNVYSPYILERLCAKVRKICASPATALNDTWQCGTQYNGRDLSADKDYGLNDVIPSHYATNMQTYV